MLQRERYAPPEELDVFRLPSRPTAFNKMNAERIQLWRYADLGFS
jgi:hypothetical protein